MPWSLYGCWGVPKYLTIKSGVQLTCKLRILKPQNVAEREYLHDTPFAIWEIQCIPVDFPLKQSSDYRTCCLKVVFFVVSIPSLLFSNYIFQFLQSQFLFFSWREVPMKSPIGNPVASSTSSQSRLDQSPVLHSAGGDPAGLLLLVLGPAHRRMQTLKP